MGPEHRRFAQAEAMALGDREDVIHTRRGVDAVANGLVVPHLGQERFEISGRHAAQREIPLHAEYDALIWLHRPMKLHVANAVAVSLLSTAVLVLAFKDNQCTTPAPATAPEAATSPAPRPAANAPAPQRPRAQRELGKF